MCATPDEQYDADDKESAQATQLEAIGLDPGDPVYHDDFGLALHDQERYEEAEAAYREAVRLDPGNAAYRDDLGRALYDQGKYEEAEAAYREAVRLDPGDPVYHDDLGLALHDQERYEEAEAAYREAVRLDPGNATYHNDLGRALYDQGKYEEAEAAQRELELDADSLPIQNRPATSRTYLSATSCLAGSLVSVGLAVTEIAEYVKHNRVGNLAILGMVIGALAGATAVAVNDEEPPGWAHRINTVAAWLAAIGVFSLLVLYGGQHGWTPDG